MRFVTSCWLVVGFLTACGETPTQAPTGEPLFEKGGGGVANSTATFRLPPPASALRLRGDGLILEAGQSVYQDGKCAVTATIFAPNPHTDAVMQTDNPQASDRRCAGVGPAAVPRTITIDYGDGTESSPATVNVHDLGSVLGTELRFLGVGLRGASRCSKLQFGGPEGGDKVWVAKLSASSWRVYSQSGGAATASCVSSTGNVVYFGMTVDFTVTTP